MIEPFDPQACRVWLDRLEQEGAPEGVVGWMRLQVEREVARRAVEEGRLAARDRISLTGREAMFLRPESPDQLRLVVDPRIPPGTVMVRGADGRLMAYDFGAGDGAGR